MRMEPPERELAMKWSLNTYQTAQDWTLEETLRISKATGYGILALAYLANQAKNRRCGLEEIAGARAYSSRVSSKDSG